MEELFENKLLDDLFNSRSDGFEAIYVKKHGKAEELRESLKVEEELVKVIKEVVKEEQNLNRILEKLNEFEGCTLGEMDFWNKLYYKLGFVDGNGLKAEIKEERKKLYPDSSESFFDNFRIDFLEYFEKEKSKYLLNRSEYKEILKKLQDIKEKYPRARAFIEDSEFADFSTEEQNAILEIMGLNNEIEVLEIEEAFKLGIREKELI